MKDPVDRAVRVLARRNALATIIASFGLMHLVAAGGLLLLTLYQRVSESDFWILMAGLQAFVLLINLIAASQVVKLWEPVRAWERGARDEASTIAAWKALATLPAGLIRRMGTRTPGAVVGLPLIALATLQLHLGWYAFPILLLLGALTVMYAVIVRYFAMELLIRPLLEDVAAGLPPEFVLDVPGLSLRWRLLLAAPIINVLTGIVVAGLASHSHRLSDLGTSVLIAVVVSFTISLELIVLVSRSAADTVAGLLDATRKVADGDLDVRVPVVATDETGALAQSFNNMVEGLEERRALVSAFGAYVDPDLAERVLREGPDLDGEEIEVTVLFLDIRNFTAFAERSKPHEVVAMLSDFWELVVPVLRRHGGHANKFVGDGLMGVFGAPEPRSDHADGAVAAALEITALVRERYEGEVGIGIGVNSGPVVAGTVGGGGKVEFTVIGDAVNTASRVESATRSTGDDVLITEATRALLSLSGLECEERPPVPLKGKTESVRLWVVAGVSADASDGPVRGRDERISIESVRPPAGGRSAAEPVQPPAGGRSAAEPVQPPAGGRR